MHSMTGYGRGAAAQNGRELTVELKSVNHRFLDLGVKLPRALAHAEDHFRLAIADALSRGHIDVFAHYSNTRADYRTVRVDTSLLYAYIDAARNANATIGLEDDLTLRAALSLPDVTSISLAEDDTEAISALVREALAQALNALITMRKNEGDRLKQDLSERFANLGANLEQIKILTERVVPNFKSKLEARINELAGDVPLDSARLATEVAIFADRASIDEEISRIGIHLEHASDLLASELPAGRKLDFLVQEFNREFNTIGSKANDAGLTALVLQAKAELEKIREQIQNIE